MVTLPEGQPISSPCPLQSQELWVLPHRAEAEQTASKMKEFLSLTIWPPTPTHFRNQGDPVKYTVMTSTPQQGSQWQQWHCPPSRQIVYLSYGCWLSQPNSHQQCYGQSSLRCPSSSKVRWSVTHKVYHCRLDISGWSSLLPKTALHLSRWKPISQHCQAIL